MNKQCKGCAVSAGTHKPSEALHQIDEKNSTLIADAKRLGFVADQIRALSPEGSEEDIYLTEASEVLEQCAERIANMETQHREELRAYEITVANREARIAELEDDLKFVERWAVHHGSKPSISAEEALSCIQHYPAIHEITKSYKDGKRPDTFNPYARIAELESQLDAIGAGGVEPLRKQAVPQAVQVIKANCYSDDNGDYWRDCPDDCDFVDGLKVGDTYELQASIRAWSETFRVTKAPDETSDDYEVELVSTDAPLAATQPAAQVVDVVQAAKALCKHAAKVQNVNFEDYWLIHAEDFKEEAQIVLDAAQAKQGGQQCTSAPES